MPAQSIDHVVQLFDDDAQPSHGNDLDVDMSSSGSNEKRVKIHASHASQDHDPDTTQGLDETILRADDESIAVHVGDISQSHAKESTHQLMEKIAILQQQLV